MSTLSFSRLTVIIKPYDATPATPRMEGHPSNEGR